MGSKLYVGFKGLGAAVKLLLGILLLVYLDGVLVIAAGVVLVLSAVATLVGAVLGMRDILSEHEETAKLNESPEREFFKHLK